MGRGLLDSRAQSWGTVAITVKEARIISTWCHSYRLIRPAPMPDEMGETIEPSRKILSEKSKHKVEVFVFHREESVERGLVPALALSPARCVQMPSSPARSICATRRRTDNAWLRCSSGSACRHPLVSKGCARKGERGHRSDKRDECPRSVARTHQPWAQIFRHSWLDLLHDLLATLQRLRSVVTL
jgi:hypothetical protein